VAAKNIFQEELEGCFGITVKWPWHGCRIFTKRAHRARQSEQIPQIYFRSVCFRHDCAPCKIGRTDPVDVWVIGNESVPKIIINDTINLFCKTAIIILAISNHNSFRVLFDSIASVGRIFYLKNTFIFQHRKWPARGTRPIPRIISRAACVGHNREPCKNGWTDRSSCGQVRLIWAQGTMCKTEERTPPRREGALYRRHTWAWPRRYTRYSKCRSQGGSTGLLAGGRCT